MMNRTHTTLLMATLTLFGLSTSAADAITLRQASRPAVASVQDLHEQARRARTAAEHASVARQFRLRADALAQDLAAVDAELKEVPREPRNSLRYKWPALGQPGGATLRQRAMDLRRARVEAQRAAAHHTQLAVEHGFSAE